MIQETSMMHVLRESQQSLRSSPIFAFYVLVALGVGGVIGLMTFRPELFPGMSGMNHFGELSHRTHDVAFGLLFTTSIVGLLSQLRRPAMNVAGMVMALVPGAALLLAAVLSTDAGVVTRNPLRSAVAVTVVAALLHPTGRGFFRSFRFSRVDPMLLALVGITAVPLLGFASKEIDLQRSVPDEHAGMGHYGFMAALSFTVIGLGVLASLRPDGWRLTAWVTGLLPALLAVTSMVYPDASSSLDRGWASAAIAWGVVFIAVAERSRHIEHPTMPVPGRRPLASAQEG
jgi:hypothetical protein